MNTTADTPLSRALKHLNISQTALAHAMGKRESSISRMVRHGKISPAMAADLLDAMPALKTLIDERHVLYPDREPYASWKPPIV